MASPTGIATAITFLQAMYGREKQPSSVAPLAAAWLIVLSDVDDADLLAACQAHARNPEAGRWWPTPADLIAASPNRPPSIESRWDTMRQRISGGERPHDFLSAPELAALAAIGGTWSLRRMETKEEASMRKRWIACARDGTDARRIESAYLRALPGGKP